MQEDILTRAQCKLSANTLMKKLLLSGYKFAIQFQKWKFLVEDRESIAQK